MSDIVKVDKSQAAEIIEKRLPLGMFYHVDGNIFVGIDNRTGDAWTEDFKTLGVCKRWLRR